jgi:hypothetical protein
VEAHAGQDLELGPALDVQAVDDIEAVELDLPGGDIGEVPAPWRRRSPDAAVDIEGTPPLEDPVDRPRRRDAPGQIRSDEQLAPDRLRAVFAERARVLELLAQRQDQRLEVRWGPGDVARDRRAVGPVDPLKRRVARPAEPELDRREADPARPSDRSLRAARPDRGDPLPPLRFGPRGRVFSATSSPHYVFEERY